MNKIGAVGRGPLAVTFLGARKQASLDHLSRQIRNDLAALFSTVQSVLTKRRQKM